MLESVLAFMQQLAFCEAGQPWIREKQIKNLAKPPAEGPTVPQMEELTPEELTDCATQGGTNPAIRGGTNCATQGGAVRARQGTMQATHVCAETEA